MEVLYFAEIAEQWTVEGFEEKIHLPGKGFVLEVASNRGDLYAGLGHDTRSAETWGC